MSSRQHGWALEGDSGKECCATLMVGVDLSCFASVRIWEQKSLCCQVDLFWRSFVWQRWLVLPASWQQETWVNWPYGQYCSCFREQNCLPLLLEASWRQGWCSYIPFWAIELCCVCSWSGVAEAFHVPFRAYITSRHHPLHVLFPGD